MERWRGAGRRLLLVWREGNPEDEECKMKGLLVNASKSRSRRRSWSRCGDGGMSKARELSSPTTIRRGLLRGRSGSRAFAAASRGSALDSKVRARHHATRGRRWEDLTHPMFTVMSARSDK